MFSNKVKTKKPAKVGDEAADVMTNQMLGYVYRFFWLINLIVIIIVFVVAYLFFLRPQYLNIVSNAKVNRAADSYLEQLMYYKQLLELKQVYLKIDQTDREKINSIVSVANEKNELFREFQYIIFSKGMTTVSIEPVEMDDNFVPPALSINSRGGNLLASRRSIKTTIKIADANYTNLLDMLKVLELNQRIMDVSKINYDPAKHTAELEVLTYKQR
ncbi:hypothetical protein COT94_01765 [Candidatus Falkowbacteria bacterium CG10_big_fil_rev_8_21_14_0_10_37_14]|uniref:Uncharacterized protein n=1 Tax=Candidatus Falkowbacteria bacterium CG10_big_fil_rev_8_21_14_0_10_37_14 TaxID=1974561 RepID=A0A2M6WTP8_9BACT|nr:hypothetical protein [Candidatus Falkowbacteria bacterium]PIT96173.1 MAG: hypothetical protein COT94_01765 [Candidatus Falkowbacteria bacterium CG10_big_fil_rev_8_21_14_0_10_37_14]